ncbi:MAG: peroxiredoxin [Anderseniella sp.]|nr:peroxiredoxin [Anderseniella sp.]
MTISVGDKMPEATFNVMTAEGPGQMTSAELFDGRKVVIFAVPGAFTPTCHMKHLPGFISNADALKAKGVDTIACVSVNDVFVMNAWAEQSGAKNKITFLADGSANFTKAIGMDLDASGFGMGIRSKRYAMLVDNGVVKVINEEDAPGKAEISSAEEILKAL